MEFPKVAKYSCFPILAFLAPCLLQADSVVFSPIYVSIGPNANGPSPSYIGYTADAQAGVIAGGVNEGGNIAFNPAAYNVIGSGSSISVPNSKIIGTPFNSWLGTADPGGAFFGESGNMLYWSIEITGSAGNNIALANVNVTQFSTDPLDAFGEASVPGGLYTASYAGSTYAPDAVGIFANGTTITSGDPSTSVHAIVLTGFAADLDPGILSLDTGVVFSGTDAEQMQQMISAFDTYLGNFSINTCFYYGAVADPTSQSTCDSTLSTESAPGTITPEPATLILSAFICVYLWLNHRSQIFKKKF